MRETKKNKKTEEIAEVTLRVLHENKKFREKLGGENHHYD